MIGNRSNRLLLRSHETDVCCLAAVLDAFDLGYRVIDASDALCSVSDEAHDICSSFSERFQPDPMTTQEADTQ
jgi:nicotinamidase-related amidase